MLQLCNRSSQNQLRKGWQRLQSNLPRRLSALVPPKESSDEKERNDKSTILYQRDPERNKLPRASFLVSSINSIYWVWYVVDFVPAVNASPIDDFHIDPVFGFGGLGLSLLIQTAFTFYPLSLVSKIVHRESTDATKENTMQQRQREILVWKHSLPFMRLSPKPLVFPPGALTMDKASENTRIILDDHGGDIGRFEGHLGLKTTSKKGLRNTDWSSRLMVHLPLLVDIRNPSEVYDSDLMFRTFLSNRLDDSPKGGRNVHSTTRNRDKYHQERAKNRRKKRHRGKK